jgi:hypothetical protein
MAFSAYAVGPLLGGILVQWYGAQHAVFALFVITLALALLTACSPSMRYRKKFVRAAGGSGGVATYSTSGVYPQTAVAAITPTPLTADTGTVVTLLVLPSGHIYCAMFLGMDERILVFALQAGSGSWTAKFEIIEAGQSEERLHVLGALIALVALRGGAQAQLDVSQRRVRLDKPQRVLVA